MSETDPKFDPAGLEEITGFSPEFMREARRRFFGGFFGRQQSNGRWAYNIRDVVGLVVGRRLHERGFRQELAFTVGVASAPYVIGHLIDPTDVCKNNCVIAFLDVTDPEKYAWPIVSVNDLPDVFANNDRESCLFPIRPLAEALPPEIKILVIDEVRD